MRGRFSRGAKFVCAYGSLSVGLMLAGALLTGCGSSSNSSSGQAVRTAAGSGAAGHEGPAGAGSAASGRSEASRTSKPAKLPSGTVARVDGIPITLAAYTHQLQINAQGPVKPLISGASDYPACVAALKSREERTEKLIKAQEEKYAKRFKGRKSPGFAQRRKPVGSTQRKRQCEQLYKFAKQQAVSSLIRQTWTQAQAKELGVSVSESEVASQVKTRESSQKALAKNPRLSAFALSEVPHYTKAELMEVVKNQLLQSKVFMKIREKFVKPGSVSQGQEQGMFKYNEEIRIKQREKTECAAGYLTPLCK